MRFQVPQFIEVEDKIFGPLTLRQFIYLAGGGGLSFLVYVLLDSVVLAAIPILLILIGSAALAFYKLDKRFPLIYVAESAIKYWVGSKLYIWKKEERAAPKNVKAAIEDAKHSGVAVPKISDSKLKDLSWSLDIKESIYSNKNQR